MKLEGTVEVQYRGKRYQGHWSVARRMLTVHYGMRDKITQLSGSPPDVLARILLRELLNETIEP